MKKFLKILTTALGSLMVVCPQFDVYGMETTVKNKGLSLEDQIKKVESFIGSSAANRYIAKNETRHVATAVAVSILGIDNDVNFLRSLNATYDEFTKTGRDNDFRRIMGLLNAWIGSESVTTLKNEIILGFKNGSFNFEPKDIYKKSVDRIWGLLTNNDYYRNWGDVVRARFGKVYPNNPQVYNSEESVVENYFFHDWNLRFVESRILNFVQNKFASDNNIINQQEFSAQTTNPNVKFLNNNKPELKTELINTSVKKKNNGLPSKGQSKPDSKNARNVNVLVRRVLIDTLLNSKNKDKNLTKHTKKMDSHKLNQSQKGSSIGKEKIAIDVNKSDVKQTSKPVKVPIKNIKFQDMINNLDAKFIQGPDKKGNEKLIDNNKNDSIASKSETIANMVSAINNNVLESNNTVTDKPKVVVGNGPGVPPPPPPNIPKPVKDVKTDADRTEVLKNVAKIADAKKKDEAPKKTSNSKTGSGGGAVSSNSGSQNNGKNAPMVQIATTDVKDQLAAKFAQLKGERKDQANIENDSKKDVAKSNNIRFPNLRSKNVETVEKIDYTKEDSVKNLWDAYRAVCVYSSRGSGNMTNIVTAKGAATGYGHLDKKIKIFEKNFQTGLDSIRATADLLPGQEFEKLNIEKRYDVNNNDNIVNFDNVFKSLNQKEFARVQLYYILKYVNTLGQIPILTGTFEKDRINNKKVEKYNSKKKLVDRDLLKQALVPVFAYQHWSATSMSKSTKFIGFRVYSGVNFKNFNIATDSELSKKTGDENKDLARSQLYTIINTLLYKRFNEKWFDDKSK